MAQWHGLSSRIRGIPSVVMHSYDSVVLVLSIIFLDNS
jgi:hypothetical protein